MFAEPAANEYSPVDVNTLPKANDPVLLVTVFAEPKAAPIKPETLCPLPNADEKAPPMVCPEPTPIFVEPDVVPDTIKLGCIITPPPAGLLPSDVRPLIVPFIAIATNGDPEVVYPPEYTVTPELRVTWPETVPPLANKPTGWVNPSGFFMYSSYWLCVPVPLLAYKAVCPVGGLAIWAGCSVKSLMYDGIFYFFV